jgi:DNA (cytosine-5)-methyltransferase 1
VCLAVPEWNGESGYVRKLTITEWERLQGFPDGYTAIEGASDAMRRRAIGNSFAVPVVRWIGRRIMIYERTRGQ